MSNGSGLQIRKMRKRMKHTQRSLAAAIGVHPMTVSQWERGLKKPHRVFMQSIINLYQETIH